MTEFITIARPYAEALFGMAEASSTTDWLVFIEELAQLVRLPEMLFIISNPKINRQQISALLLSTAKSPLKDSAQAKNLVQMLIDNHRLQLLPEIARLFKELKNTRECAADVLIISAFSLQGAPLDELVASLERKFQRKLNPIVQVDPSLIGGVRVTVNDEVLDISVRAQLVNMQTALTA